MYKFTFTLPDSAVTCPLAEYEPDQLRLEPTSLGNSVLTCPVSLTAAKVSEPVVVILLPFYLPTRKWSAFQSVEAKCRL
jgi:hypothetical protein